MMIRWMHANDRRHGARPFGKCHVLAVVLFCLLGALPVSAQERVAVTNRESLTLLEALQDAVVQIQQMTGPAVVSLKTEARDRRAPSVGKDVPKGEAPHRGVGSGVIIDSRGFVLTNNHVIERAEAIDIILSDGRTFKGTVVGHDSRTDLAVIKVDTTEPLPTAVLGDSGAVKVGHWVVAIGNPFGLGHSLTTGVVSGVGRGELGLAAYEDYIQTDAAINPGNSGGPLLNIRGEVIGINTAINPSGRGIAFAIPINSAKAIMQQLVEQGRVVRGFLGVVIQTLSTELAAKFDVDNDHGVLISDIVAGSPAEKAGLKRGDVILDFAGQRILKMQELQRLVAATLPGTTIEAKVLRDRQEQHVAIEIEELRDPEPKAEPAGSRYGLTLDAVTKEHARQFDLKTDQGVIITNVEGGSAAARDGIRKGDVILEIERSPVATLDAFQDAVSKLDPNIDVLLLILRQDRTFYTILHAPRG